MGDSACDRCGEARTGEWCRGCERVRYVYCCVQGMPAGPERTAKLAGYKLAPRQLALVNARLTDLDARRAAKESAQPKDHYWSLWGTLKARHRRDEAAEEEFSEALEHGSFVAECVAEYHDARRRPAPVLPNRRIRVEYDGEALVIGGRRKPVKNDAHAVNTLRKLDTDDAYFRQFHGQ